MTYNIYCYNYNNYYNRLVKKEATLASYGDPIHIEYGVNFNFSDGVNTSQVINTDLNPDYIILADDDLNIYSRWFVIDANYTRNGQHVFNLHRDVIVDNYDSIIDAPMFIEKATLNNNDPFIFNKENMTFNQIKTSETPLKDETGVAWIVGYIDREQAAATLNDLKADVVTDFTAQSIGDFEDDIGAYIGEQYFKLKNKTFGFKGIRYDSFTNSYSTFQVEYDLSKNKWNPLWIIDTIKNGPIPESAKPYVLFDYDFNNTSWNDLENQIHAAFSSHLYEIKNLEYVFVTDSSNYSDEKYNTVSNLNNKVLNIVGASETGYKRLLTETETNVSNLYNVTFASTVEIDCRNALNQIPSYNSTVWKSSVGPFRYYRKVDLIQWNYQQLAEGVYNVNIPGEADRLHLKDAPYDMFCIPYAGEDTTVSVSNSDNVIGFAEFSIPSNLALTISQGIAKGLGKDKLIDLQLLPYCPMTGFNITKSGNDISIDINASNPKRFSLVKKTIGGVDTNECILIWSTASSGTKNITDVTIDITDPKIENECDLYRLVSPNYNGQFEFSAAKNNGVSLFNVDYTYLPYTPYIHINPAFNNLYGQDFNDARGLICAGDFSISYLTDKWTEYKNQNKNYQNIFDRQIQNMEVQNNYNRTNDIIGAITGTVGGAVTGAAAGGVAGGIVGGVASAAGGVADIVRNEALRNEAMDYTKDLFGYQLGNIQALPNSLAKVTAYNENNKIFPILEYYTCTDTEKEALRNKLKYNGMTVMRIGTINEFLQQSKSYIKGKLIRLEDIGDDFHMANTIAKELYEGVFI